MPSDCRQTQPRSHNQFVQPMLRKIAQMSYHRARATNRIYLAIVGDITAPTISAGYMQELSTANCQDQKTFAKLKSRSKIMQRRFAGSTTFF